MVRKEDSNPNLKLLNSRFLYGDELPRTRSRTHAIASSTLSAIWFEARRGGKIGNFEIRKSLIFNNHARGMSVAKPPKSTTKHHRITQKSRNHLALLDRANHLVQLPACGTLNGQSIRATTWLSRKSPARPVVSRDDCECRGFKSWARFRSFRQVILLR